MLQLVMPKNYINVAAGLISLIFERLGAIKEEVQRDPDDLTKINGIGPTFAKRLTEAGLDSFAKLAAASPAQVKEAAKLADWQADPKDWIAAAQMMA